MYVPVSHKGVGDGASSSLETPKSHSLIWPLELTSTLEGFDVAMHDAMGAPEVRQAAEDGFGDFAENVDSNGTKVLENGIQRAAEGQKGR